MISLTKSLFKWLIWENIYANPLTDLLARILESSCYYQFSHLPMHVPTVVVTEKMKLIKYIKLQAHNIGKKCRNIMLNIKNTLSNSIFIKMIEILKDNWSKIKIWWLTSTLFFSLESGVFMYASDPQLPITVTKQFVVWPIPDGNIFSVSIALITVLLPLLVLPKNATFMLSLASTAAIPDTWLKLPATWQKIVGNYS